jgi:hypothetical protein
MESNGRKTITFTMSLLVAGCTIMGAFVGYIASRETRARAEQRVADNVEVLMQMKADHSVTHQAIDRDLHGAILIGQAAGEKQLEAAQQQLKTEQQVDRLAAEVRNLTVQVSEISRIRVALKTNSAEISELRSEVERQNEAVNSLTKGIRKKWKKQTP